MNKTIALADFIATSAEKAKGLLCLMPEGVAARCHKRSDSIRVDVDIDGIDRAVSLVVDTTLAKSAFVPRATIVTAGLHMEGANMDAMVDSVIVLRSMSKVIMSALKDTTVTV